MTENSKVNTQKKSDYSIWIILIVLILMLWASILMLFSVIKEKDKTQSDNENNFILLCY
jgi:flagellar basal body-associated protein FliL